MHSFIDAALCKETNSTLSPFKECGLLFEVTNSDKSSHLTRYFLFWHFTKNECDRQFIREYYNDNMFPHGMKPRVHFSLKGDIISLQTI